MENRVGQLGEPSIQQLLIPTARPMPAHPSQALGRLQTRVVGRKSKDLRDTGQGGNSLQTQFFWVWPPVLPQAGGWAYTYPAPRAPVPLDPPPRAYLGLGVPISGTLGGGAPRLLRPGR